VWDPAGSVDGEAHGKVRDVVGEHVGGVGDPDPALAAPGEVDVVEADGVAHDDLEPRERVDELRVAAGTAATAGDHGPDRRGVGAEEFATAVMRGIPEAQEAAAAVQLLLQVRVQRAQEQHAQGFHRCSGRSSVREVGWARTNKTRQLGGRVGGLDTSPMVQI